MPLLASGTVCPSTSFLHLRCLSSGHASRLISSPFPIPVRDHVQCSRSDTGHFNRSCFLLTYLLTHAKRVRLDRSELDTPRFLKRGCAFAGRRGSPSAPRRTRRCDYGLQKVERARRPHHYRTARTASLDGHKIHALRDSISGLEGHGAHILTAPGSLHYGQFVASISPSRLLYTAAGSCRKVSPTGVMRINICR